MEAPAGDARLLFKAQNIERQIAVALALRRFDDQFKAFGAVFSFEAIAHDAWKIGFGYRLVGKKSLNDVEVSEDVDVWTVGWMESHALKISHTRLVRNDFVKRCLGFLVTLPAVLRNGIVNWKKRFASRGEQNQGRNYQAQGIKLLHVCRTFAKNSVQGGRP